jgi:hypothetical protein
MTAPHPFDLVAIARDSNSALSGPVGDISQSQVVNELPAS